jgi:hypothetical protein
MTVEVENGLVESSYDGCSFFVHWSYISFICKCCPIEKFVVIFPILARPI